MIDRIDRIDRRDRCCQAIAALRHRLDQLAAALAEVARAGDRLALVGPLGAGKTQFAKGFAVDRVSMALAGEGLTNHMVEIGGEVFAAGSRIDGMPWRIGTIQLDAGPTVLAHIHGDVGEFERVRMIARTDKSGQGVMMALPEKETPNMADDRQLRTLTCDPKYRRALVTD